MVMKLFHRKKRILNQLGMYEGSPMPKNMNEAILKALLTVSPTAVKKVSTLVTFMGVTLIFGGLDVMKSPSKGLPERATRAYSRSQ